MPDTVADLAADIRRRVEEYAKRREQEKRDPRVRAKMFGVPSASARLRALKAEKRARRAQLRGDHA